MQKYDVLKFIPQRHKGPVFYNEKWILKDLFINTRYFVNMLNELTAVS